MINNKTKARHNKSSLKKITCFVFVFLFSFLFCLPFFSLNNNVSKVSAYSGNNFLKVSFTASNAAINNTSMFLKSSSSILSEYSEFNSSLFYDLIGFQMFFSYRIVGDTSNLYYLNATYYIDESNFGIYPRGSDGNLQGICSIDTSNSVKCLFTGADLENITLQSGYAFYYVYDDSISSGYTEEEYLQYGENQYQAGFDEANKVYVNYSDTITLNSSNLEFTYNLDDYISIDDIDFEIKRKYTTIAGGSGSGDIQQGEIVENVDTFTDTFTLVELTTYSGGVNPGGQLLGDNYSSVRLGYNSTDNNLTFYFLGSDKAEVTFVINGYRYPYTFDEVEDLEDNSYNNGYNTGYDNGLSFGYENGLLQGSSEGFDYGYSQGFDAGESSALNSNETFADMIFAIIDAPFNVLNNAFDFTFFGINVANFLMVIVSLILVAFVVKKIL